jgi:hypothetical protein
MIIIVRDYSTDIPEKRGIQILKYMAKKIQKDDHLKIYLKKALESEFINGKVFFYATSPLSLMYFWCPCFAK